MWMASGSSATQRKGLKTMLPSRHFILSGGDGVPVNNAHMFHGVLLKDSSEINTVTGTADVGYAYVTKLSCSNNHRYNILGWKGHQRSFSSNSLLQAELSTARSGHSGPNPTKLFTPPGTGLPQLL